jgi:phage tail sheath protein FI
MAAYRTPGVYVEEISTLPASIAQVDTAVPAFIGVTETAFKGQDEVKNQAVRITSLVDFEEIFGGGPPINVTGVVINNDNSYASSTATSKYILYDSLRMFYLNGGGECYVTSIAYYTDPDPVRTGYEGAIDKLKKVDEPTLILYPDASTILSPSDLYTLQDYTLTHCATMQDRFAVLDVLSPTPATSDPVTDATNYRNGIGMGNLKYGAAYYPWLQCNLDLNIKYRDIKSGKGLPSLIQKNGTPVTAADLTTDATAKANANWLDNVVDSNRTIEGEIAGLSTAPETIREKFNRLKTTMDAATTNAGARDGLAAIFLFLFQQISAVDHWIDGAHANVITDSGSADHFLEKARAEVTASFDAVANTLLGYDAEAVGDFTSATYTSQAIATVATQFTDTPTASTIFNGANNLDRVAGASSAILSIFEQVYGGLLKIQGIGATLETSLSQTVSDTIPAVRNALRGINQSLTTLPPSGTVVGVYARVDRNRGVWKAPANESLIGVKGLTQEVTFEDQEKLNVDTNAGKSINAIRKFTGRGILIWGARTLAGNDAEWRYVPVRRLYIMVEESIKKATEFVVFEPNDANTWVRVKGMIKNFLTDLWKQGALAGAKPDHAFFVNVGLGETMTAQDILDGKMIVEIGLAAVRPAEFIILRFSHKLQES